MRQRIAAWLVGAGLCFSVMVSMTGAGRAASLQGYSLPDAYPVVGQTLVLNGMGIRKLTVFAVKVYVAGLYVTRKSTDAAAILNSPGPKVMLLQFLHAASKSDIEKQYREGEEKNCGHGECAPSDQGDFERLIEGTPGMAVGDTLTYVYTAQGVRVLVNNRVIGEFANPDLARRLLLGFIGPVPPSEDLKRHLLGLDTE